MAGYTGLIAANLLGHAMCCTTRKASLISLDWGRMFSQPGEMACLPVGIWGLLVLSRAFNSVIRHYAA